MADDAAAREEAERLDTPRRAACRWFGCNGTDHAVSRGDHDAMVKFIAADRARARKEALEEAAKRLCFWCNEGRPGKDGYHHFGRGNRLQRCSATRIYALASEGEPAAAAETPIKRKGARKARAAKPGKGE